MKVTYIGHSGFLVETKMVNLLFDYSEGEVPEVNKEIPLLVFVSHNHHDHYNPAIFSLVKRHPDVRYILSKDVFIKEEVKKEYSLDEVFLEDKVTFVPPGLKRIISLQQDKVDGTYVTLDTIKSTDEGVAFVLEVAGKRIYHAGDLNCWVWEDDTKQEYNNMSAMFKRAMEKLGDREIYLAFAPLDPRQGRFYKVSMEYLLNAAPITYVVPMHVWGQYDIIDRYEKERITKDLPTKVLKFSEHLESKEI